MRKPLIILFGLLVISTLLIPITVQAKDGDKPFCGGIPEDICQKVLKASFIKEENGQTVVTSTAPIEPLINAIINIATGLFVTAIVLVLVVSGVQMAASAGNPDVIKSAKEHIFNAVLGLILLISTRAILSLFGENVFDTGFKSPITLFNQVNTANLYDFQKVLINGIHLASFAAGVVAVIFIIVGAIRYIGSGGSPDTIENAKKTIIYAVGGLVLAIMAYGIVSFIINNLG